MVTSELSELYKSKNEITSHLNLENYLGDSLWKEFCAFRREDSYENTNYVSDGLNNSQLLEKANELLENAKKQIITSSTTQWSLTANMYNLLVIPEFVGLTEMFEGGNWIRAKIDDTLYRLRLIHLDYQMMTWKILK